MTDPREDLDALTDAERDALAAFDDLVEATTVDDDAVARANRAGAVDAEPRQEMTMKTRWMGVWTNWTSAAGLLAAFLGLSAVLWSTVNDFGSTEAAIDWAPPILAAADPAHEVVFMISLKDHDRVTIKRATMPERGRIVTEDATFDLGVADRQRAQAIEDGRTKDGPYRDGTSYRLKDGNGRPLPVWWKPFAPCEARTWLKIDRATAAKALRNARAGKPYDKKHIGGMWVYAPPPFYVPGSNGFTEKAVVSATASVDVGGHRAVDFRVAKKRATDWTNFTKAFVMWRMAIVVDDEVWTAPTIRAPLGRKVQITGANGFTEPEQTRLLEALGAKPSGR